MTTAPHVHVHAREGRPSVSMEAATLMDVVNVAGGRGFIVWRVLREMWRNGQSWAYRDRAGALVGVGGLYPYRAGPDGLPYQAGDGMALAGDGAPPDHAEAWFQFTPLSGPLMLGIARATRLTLDAQTYRAVICHCVTPEGARFARLVGFTQGPTTPAGEIWKR